MNKSEFNQIVKNENNLSHTNKKDIDKLKQSFPYCEIIHYYSLLKAHFSDDVSFSEILQNTALYSSNRKKLFHLIHPEHRVYKEKNNTRSFENWLNENSLNFNKNNNNKIQEYIKKSTEDNDNLTTETLAKIYLEQGHYERAIQAYKILCLKYPKKSGFFANQIKKIKNKIN